MRLWFLKIHTSLLLNNNWFWSPCWNESLQSWLFISDQIDSRGMTHNFVDTCTPTSGRSSWTFSSLSSDLIVMCVCVFACRLPEQFWPIWLMRKGSIAMCCGSTCRRSWCWKETGRFSHQGSRHVRTSQFPSHRLTRKLSRWDENYSLIWLFQEPVSAEVKALALPPGL